MINLLKKLFSLLSPTDRPLVDAHNDSTNSNFSRGKNSPVVTVTNNMSANEESLRAKIIELQTENEKLKSEFEVLKREYDRLISVEPVPDKCYLRHTKTKRLVCPNCFNNHTEALSFLTAATYNNNRGMECQVCNKFYPDNHNA